MGGWEVGGRSPVGRRASPLALTGRTASPVAWDQHNWEVGRHATWDTCRLAQLLAHRHHSLFAWAPEKAKAEISDEGAQREMAN